MVDGLKGKAKLAYTAGILDGEGTVFLERRVTRKGDYRNYVLTVVISNTNEWLIKWLEFNYGGNVSSYQQKHPNRLLSWRWRIQATKAMEFLRLVLPYLILKRPQAEIAIQFQLNRSHRHRTDEEKAVDEAQKLLISSYNSNSGCAKGRLKKYG